MKRVHGMELAAPRSTSREIVEKLNKQINTAVADPIIKARLVEQGGTVFRGSPTDFEKLIAEDTTKWAKVIRGANIKPECPPSPHFREGAMKLPRRTFLHLAAGAAALPAVSSIAKSQ